MGELKPISDQFSISMSPENIFRGQKNETWSNINQNLNLQKQSTEGVLKKKKRLWHRCFPVNFVKFLRTSFFIEHLRWLLLNLHLKNTRKFMQVRYSFLSFVC